MSSSVFKCEVLAKHKANHARVTRVTTAHGVFETPAFMPVGTRAGVNNMTPSELKVSGSQIILGGNTYHMLCAPGMKIIEQAGGMHRFMGWHGPMLTDSGGFQVFSLSKNGELCTIDEEGAHFKLPNQQGVMHMTPEMSLQTQKIIGADIIMAFDQCTPDAANREDAEHILQRTHRWLQQSVSYHHHHPTNIYGQSQALFGIIQGGTYPDLRQKSAQFIVDAQTDGIAIGGETIGFNMPTTLQVLDWVRPILPEHKPRYTMGVGMFPQDLIDVVAQGVDMFDCVAPTRNARHGALYCGQMIEKDDWFRFDSIHELGRIQIKKSEFSQDFGPVMDGCGCYTCQFYSRSCLHHLFKQKSNLFTALATIHNIHVMHDVCTKMRNKIKGMI